MRHRQSDRRHVVPKAQPNGQPKLFSQSWFAGDRQTFNELSEVPSPSGTKFCHKKTKDSTL